MRIRLLLALLPVVAFPAAAQQAQLDAAFADTSMFPAVPALLRLYYDCDEARWPWGTGETFVPKTREEVGRGLELRQGLERRWREHFARRAGDTIRQTPESLWAYPLAVRGRLVDNYWNARDGGPHEALDIFVTREGAEIRSPVSGVVVASGDDWRGGYERRGRGFWYEGGGLSRRAGNGVLIFDPASGGYHYLVHMQEGVFVRTGDVVRAGQPLGRVGHTGNASFPGRGRHLHYAFKVPGSDCGFENVLIGVDTYDHMRAARARMRR